MKCSQCGQEVKDDDKAKRFHVMTEHPEDFESNSLLLQIQETNAKVIQTKEGYARY